MTPKKELLFVALGGSGEIGMNVNLYGTAGKWLMVDCGVTFADPAYPGIDVMLPDLQFIEERGDQLLGIVITHGHEDHIGALPYLAADLGVPLEFGNVSVPTYPPSMQDDITRPGSDDRQAASGDPHLIDFDMFDVALPPIDKTPPKS